MPSIHISSDVNAPVEQVFAVFTDFARAADRIQGINKIEILTEGGFTVGMRFRETRTMFGKQASETMEITDIQPGQSYTVTGNSCGARIDTTFRFTPTPTGTHVDCDCNVKAMTFFAKLMTPLSYLMMGPMRKIVALDIEDLKKVIEQGDIAVTNPPEA